MATSSESGKKMISTDMENLTSDFQNLFIEIADLKEELGAYFQYLKREGISHF